jgi:hypothetical protein
LKARRDASQQRASWEASSKQPVFQRENNLHNTVSLFPFEKLGCFEYTSLDPASSVSGVKFGWHINIAILILTELRVIIRSLISKGSTITRPEFTEDSSLLNFVPFVPVVPIWYILHLGYQLSNLPASGGIRHIHGTRCPLTIRLSICEKTVSRVRTSLLLSGDLKILRLVRNFDTYQNWLSSSCTCHMERWPTSF